VDIIEYIVSKNGLIFAFLLVGAIMMLSFWISRNLTFNKIPLFAGMAFLGGSMLRDFSVVATAMGADLNKIRQAGLAGIIALFSGVTVSFFIGVTVALGMGYTDAVSLTTIGAGACTYIVGPVTGAALGASSDIIAISIATGVVKSIMVTIGTPLIAKRIGLNNPHSAVVFGGLLGTTSGVVAGLAATDPKLVPYGALTATFYTGLGCLLCPSLFFILVRLFTG